MGRYSSDTDSDSKGRSSSKKSKKKSKSRKRRSRSSSYDSRWSRDTRRRSSRSRSRSSNRSRDDRRRRYRSRSRDSYDSRKVSKRSRSRTPRRYRSRSRSHSRGYSRGKNRSRSRSRSRDKSRRKKSSRNRSRSRDKSRTPRREKATTKPKDPCENIPGFLEMTPSQQSRIRIQAAFKVADAAIQKEVPADTQAVASAIEQIDRAQVIEDIEDEGFMPSHFTSSRSAKTKENATSLSWPSNLADQENYHELAIFGNSNALGLDDKTKKDISDASEKMSGVKLTIKWDQRDIKTLAHPNLNVSFEDAEKRWLDKLKCMRLEKLKTR